MDRFCSDNLSAFIAAIETHPARWFDLHPSDAFCHDCIGYAGGALLSGLPHFQALGVFATETGAPSKLGADSRRMELDELFTHLFGWYGAHSADIVLLYGYGECRWDAQLMSWFAAPPGSKQLILARLYHAREVALGLAGAAVPGSSPSTSIARALSLPAPNPAPARQLANLQALQLALDGFCVEFGPAYPGLDGTPASHWYARDTLAAFVATLPYFRSLGVLPDDDGMPHLSDADGAQIATHATLDCLFGVVAGERASEVLFGISCDWRSDLLRWDRSLARNLPPDPGEKLLARARVRHALDSLARQGAVGTPGDATPQPLSPPLSVE